MPLEDGSKATLATRHTPIAVDAADSEERLAAKLRVACGNYGCYADRNQDACDGWHRPNEYSAPKICN